MSSGISLDGVDIHVAGGGAETIVMVHGWPDTYRLWDSAVEALKTRYRCIRFTLPGFDPSTPHRAYTLGELIDFVDALVERFSPGGKVILMLHDWGCIVGYQYYVRHPERVAKIVGVDIGDAGSLRRVMTAREKLIAVAYQVWLALAWKIGGGVGTWMNRFMAWLGGAPSDRTAITWRMGYPYYVLWFGGRGAFRGQVRRFTPACPMLFIYGRRKPLRFHAPAWAEELGSKPGNEVIEFDTGHWVMAEQPERFNAAVSAWLARASAASRTT
jgi:pimeloyl-ACP methyl ester carboxylesterase